MQQDDDFDTHKEKRDPLLGLIPDSLMEFIKKEAVLIALTTGIGYFLTYRFHASYLSYFGVADTFVDLGLSQIITSTVGVSFLLFSIYQMTTILPMPALGRFFEAIFVFPYLSFPIFF